MPVLIGMGETITRQEMVREVADRLDATPELVTARMKAGVATPAAARPGRRRDGGGAAEARRAAPRADPAGAPRGEMLALCMDAPEDGAATTSSASAPSTSPRRSSARVFERLREHPGDPLDGLGEAESALINAITRLQALDQEPATKENLEFRWMLLERDRLDRGAAAARRPRAAAVVAMQKERGRLQRSPSRRAARRRGSRAPAR